MKRFDHVCFREGLQHLDGNDANFLALTAQIGGNCFGVIGDGAEADQNHVSIFAREGLDRRIVTPGQSGIFRHGFADKARHIADKVGAMIDAAGLIVRLVLDTTGQARIVNINLCRNPLTGAFLKRIQPLAPPLVMQFGRDQLQCFVD